LQSLALRRNKKSQPSTRSSSLSNETQFLCVSRHGLGGKIVLLRFFSQHPDFNIPGYDGDFNPKIQEKEVVERVRDELGLFIPCFDSMFLRASLDNNEPMKNAKNFKIRCYAFVADDFTPSSEEEHTSQLKALVNFCSQLAEDVQKKKLAMNNNQGIVNKWERFSPICDLTIKGSGCFKKPYSFPSLDFVVTESSVVNFCKGLWFVGSGKNNERSWESGHL
jgi:hypothetical protein